MRERGNECVNDKENTNTFTLVTHASQYIFFVTYELYVFYEDTGKTILKRNVYMCPFELGLLAFKNLDVIQNFMWLL